MKDFNIRKILIYLLGTFIIVVSSNEITEYFYDYYDDNALLIRTILNIILIAFVISLIKKEPTINYQNLNNKKVLSFIIIIAIIYFSSEHLISYKNLYPNISQKRILYFTMRCITTGFLEELLMRILIFSLIIKFFLNSKLYKIKSIILTSLLFSAMHLSGLFKESMDIESVFNQLIFAFMIGVFLQCILIISENLFLVSVIHSALNFNGMLKIALFNIDSNLTTDDGNDISTIIILAIFTLFIIVPVLILALKKNIYFVKPIY